VRKAIDLAFQVGDQVSFSDLGARYPGVILHLGKNEDEATVRWKHGPRFDDYTQSEVVLSSLRFACHNHGAPFLDLKLDEDGQYKDGYHSGLAIGLVGQFYSAGGPGGILHGKDGKCRHATQHDEFDIANNKAWRRGWAAGQERAKMTKPLDFTKPLRTVGDHRPVHYVGPSTPEGLDHLICIGSKDNPPHFSGVIERINKVGSVGHGQYEVVVENVPEPQRFTFVVSPDGSRVSTFGLIEATDIVIDITIRDGKLVSMVERKP